MREAYRKLSAYRSEAAPVEVNLADNTNVFGSAPSAVRTLADAGSLAAYPPLTLSALREALAEWLDVRPEQIICGGGSNDIIDSAMRALVDPGGRMAYVTPTFVMAAHFAAANSLTPVPVPVGPGFELDVDGLLAANAPLTYVASPNNPSGTLASRGAIDRLFERAPGVLLLDEAYAEFAGVSSVREAVGRPNVIVTRTFSKAWGLAALRIGYGVASEALVTEIEKARGPFTVNAVAERAARAAIRQDQAWLAGVVDRVAACRARFVAQLDAIGLPALPSAANFVGVAVPDAPAAAAALLEQGIAVRAFQRLPVVGDLLRITIGPSDIMDRVAEALGGIQR